MPPFSIGIRDQLLRCEKGESECLLRDRTDRKAPKVAKSDPTFEGYIQQLKDKGVLSSKHREILKRKCLKIKNKDFRRLISKSLSDLSSKCNINADSNLPKIGDIDKVCGMADELWVEN